MAKKIDATEVKKQQENVDVTTLSIEEKLKLLYHLQQIDTKIDKIRIIRGELPLEVQDLEDEIVMLKTRKENYETINKELTKKINEYKKAINDNLTLIKKYKEQLMNVRNNREYDSLTKEIEFQELEIQLAEKKIKESLFQIEMNNQHIEKSKADLEEREKEVKIKQVELTEISSETAIEEKKLLEDLEYCKTNIEERLLTAYNRIRKSVRNGLAVVTIERNACAGCFNKIPPQHQLDITNYKKIIVCEFCGRILVDKYLAGAEAEAEIGMEVGMETGTGVEVEVDVDVDVDVEIETEEGVENS
ncbi:MAG: C4-type zinc ribbon domain-containing protein [Bacteroidales bacterium]|nr:C4-type zinc ribbon domain-containing protein [Bacteroidales bacterium]